MLVLSRRKDQKILFPNLGISIQIVATNGGTVRLGVDAPAQVRIVRDEIENKEFATDEELITFDQLHESKSSVPVCCDQEQFRRHVDAANLAIHLARNQLKQGLEENADDALALALESLQSLEMATLKGVSTVSPSTSGVIDGAVAVHEKRDGYQVNLTNDQPVQAAALGFSSTSKAPTATNQERILAQLRQRLQLPQLVVNFLDDDCQLMEHVCQGPRLDLVMFFGQSIDFEDEVAVPGISSLSPCPVSIELDDQHAAVWASPRIKVQALMA